jgi:NAD(P)-dependent dehydrogenase (short-subunit alcohol dehydrogenase family)
MELDGASAIVTGAASGLGAATAHTLAAAGARVLVLDLDDEHGEAVAGEIGGRYARADVADPRQVVTAIEVAEAMAPLRALVSCAGILVAQRTVGRDGSYESAHDFDAFARVLRVNLLGTFNCARLAATAMSRYEPDAEGERGVIVNTASIAAFEGQIGQTAYAASKGGIVGLTMPLARELAAVGVRVVTIAPGLIDTPIYGSGEQAEALKAQLAQDVVFPRRLGRGEEFASLALEAVRNRYLNAAVLRVDGGARLRAK